MTQVGIRERVSMRRHAGISQLLRRIALTDEARRVTISSDSALDVKSLILWIDYGGSCQWAGELDLGRQRSRVSRLWGFPTNGAVQRTHRAISQRRIGHERR